MTSVHAGVGDVYPQSAKSLANAPAAVDANVHYRTTPVRSRYEQIESVMLRGPSSLLSRHVWLLLFFHINDQKAEAFPSTERLAQWLRHTTLRPVQLALKELRETGLIEVARMRGRLTHYRLRDADGFAIDGAPIPVERRAISEGAETISEGAKTISEGAKTTPGIARRFTVEERIVGGASRLVPMPRPSNREESPAASPPTTAMASPDPTKPKPKPQPQNDTAPELVSWQGGQRAELVHLVRTLSRSTLDDHTIELSIVACMERLAEQKRRVTTARLAAWVRQGEVWARQKRSTTSATTPASPVVEPTTTTPRSEKAIADEARLRAEAKAVEAALAESQGVPAWFSQSVRSGVFSRPPEPAKSPILAVSGIDWDPDAVSAGGAQ